MVAICLIAVQMKFTGYPGNAENHRIIYQWQHPIFANMSLMQASLLYVTIVFRYTYINERSFYFCIDGVLQQLYLITLWMEKLLFCFISALNILANEILNTVQRFFNLGGSLLPIVRSRVFCVSWWDVSCWHPLLVLMIPSSRVYETVPVALQGQLGLFKSYCSGIPSS